MFTLIFMNFIVGVTSFLLIKYFFYFESVLDTIITFFILFITQVLLSLQLLGIFKVLYLNNVMILNLILLLIIYLIVKITKTDSKISLSAHYKSALNNLRVYKIEILCLSVIFGFGLVKIFINLVNPPFGWDNLNYHFTFPVEWIKNGNLINPIVVSCDFSPTYYPINGSLFFLWFILPLRNVLIADLVQIPFFIAAFLAVYSLARKLYLSKENALFSAAMFTLVPNYFKQLEIAYVDIIVAALFLIALNYLFLLYKDNSTKNIILFSIAIGLMLGTKTTAIPYACLLFIPFMYFCFVKFGLRRFFILFCISAFFMIITGGFSYIRNFLQTHNPFYPLRLGLFNKTIFRGIIDTYSLYKAHIMPGDYNLTKILFSEGLGVQTTIFLLPSIFLGIPLAIIKRKQALSFNLIYFLILPILLILIYRFIVPLPNLRYLYPLFGVGFIITFYVAEKLNLPRSILKLLIVICVLASIAELAGHLELIASLVLSFILFFILPYLLTFLKTKGIFRYAIFILIPVCLLLMFLEKDYIKNEYNRYVEMVDYSGFWPEATKGWAWLNQNTKGNNIAYIGRPVPFPLYGSNFKNNVYYVSVNSYEPISVHNLKNSKYCWDGPESMHKNFEEPNNYRGNANYSVWLDNLYKRKIDFLFIYSLHHTKEIIFPIEEQWAKDHPERFNLVFSNNSIRIYKLKR